MKSLRFAISSNTPLRAGSITWQLAQVFWVGGMWTLHFVLLKALEQLGFADALVREVEQYTRSVVVGLALVCIVLQWLVLMQALPLKKVLKDIRGQLLLVALILSSAFLLMQAIVPSAEYWLRYSYSVLGLSGLLLVVQPVPMQQHPAPSA